MSRPQQEDWENDPVWKLLDDAPRPEADPTFVSKVLREVRLSDHDSGTSTPWWKGALGIRVACGAALAAAAAVAIVATLDPTPSPGVTDQDPVEEAGPEPEPVLVVDVEEIDEVDEMVGEEMVEVAFEDPTYFTDAELLAMLD